MSDNSARNDEIAKRVAREFSELVGSYQMRFQHEDALAALVAAALTSYEEERTPTRIIEHSAVCTYCDWKEYFGSGDEAQRRWTSALVDHLAVCPSHPMRGLERQLEARTPSGEGWQQRIAALNPLMVATFHDDEGRSHMGTRCYFCGAESHSASEVTRHLPICVWQNAKDTTPPVLKDEGAE